MCIEQLFVNFCYLFAVIHTFCPLFFLLDLVGLLAQQDHVCLSVRLYIFYVCSVQRIMHESWIVNYIYTFKGTWKLNLMLLLSHLLLFLNDFA